MLVIGISSPPDVYTASIGIYAVWICGRVLSPLVSGCSKELLNSCFNSVTFWIRQVDDLHVHNRAYSLLLINLIELTVKGAAH